MKSLQIKKVTIEISANSRIDCGFATSLTIVGILPGCRKEVKIIGTPFAGYVKCQPLYGYSGSARVSPADWVRILDAATFVEYMYAKPVGGIQKIHRETAYANLRDSVVASCARQLTQAHPDHKPKFDAIVFDADFATWATKTVWTDDRIKAAARTHVAYGWARKPSGDWTPEQVAVYDTAFAAATPREDRCPNCSTVPCMHGDPDEKWNLDA